jgi:hypothetical protein
VYQKYLFVGCGGCLVFVHPDQQIFLIEGSTSPSPCPAAIFLATSSKLSGPIHSYLYDMYSFLYILYVLASDILDFSHVSLSHGCVEYSLASNLNNLFDILILASQIFENSKIEDWCRKTLHG